MFSNHEKNIPSLGFLKSLESRTGPLFKNRLTTADAGSSVKTEKYS